MGYRLALDLGTASIGLVAYVLDGDGTPVEVAYHAVRIFDEPLLPPKKSGVGEPKKTQRRLARQQRRQHQRRARRLGKLAHLASRLGLDPAKVKPDAGQSIHRLRAQAAHGRVELADLLRVLLKLAKRRGYGGGFRNRDDDEDAGVVKSGIDKLRAQMHDQGCDTLGDYLNTRVSEGLTLRLKSAGLYADRQLVLAEFECIWDEQSRHHPILAVRDETLRNDFRDAIFYQRPLRSPAPMVGNCPLEPSLRRSPTAQPAAQAFRIEKHLADLCWGNGRRRSPLTKEQKGVVRELLREHPSVNFDRIYRELEARGCPRPPLYWLNLDTSNRDELPGDKTAAAMRRLGLFAEWSALTAGHQVTVINLLADVGSPELLQDPAWHQTLMSGKGDQMRVRQFAPEVIAFVDRLAANPRFGRMAKLHLDTGRSAYCIKALRSLTEAMQVNGCDEHYAIAQVYPRSRQSEPALGDRLAMPPHTGNIVVDVALRQIRRAVNTAIDHLGGPPAQIIVELSRDMALGVKRRAEINDRIGKNTRARRQAAAAIAEHGGTADRNTVLRYLLWTEQDQHWCPYCDRPINLSDALDGAATHYEHIYPRSLTRIGKQRDFLVLAHRECNDAKGDRTPWQAWGQGQDPERWQLIQDHAERFKQTHRYGKARQLAAQETADSFIDEQVIQDFSARQFHESSWIAKEAAAWFRTICRDVMVGRGTLTAHLRRTWRLETVIPEIRIEEGLQVLDTDACIIDPETFRRYRAHWEGHSAGERTDRRPDKRIDHRHHLIDALAIGLCDRSLYQRMARHYKAVTEAGETRMRLVVEPPLRPLRDLAVALVRDCNLSRKPDRHAGGSLFLDTAYGRSADGQRLLIRKEVAKLGGGTRPSADKIRADIARIEHASTREILSRAFEERLAAGCTPAEAIGDPIEHPDYGNQIRRVALVADGNSGAHCVRHGDRQPGLFKLLRPEGYAFMEVISNPSGPPVVALVPHHLVPRRTSSPGACRFYKGDTVRDTKDGLIFVVGQIKSEGGGALILGRWMETRPVDKLNGANGYRKVSGKGLLRLELLQDV
ncbi:type II CRISPR RNA-guided endonuclease Cas9 [uncultured Thiodictyon sp.]|jgi:CRISPR-associated endonuclease Csn1|uniref:type II CRISPR RNA-guided endonuclease Cas9 n=1 Tax=uncultured Thiodictyon sp. TaxID=1846217 RepID=UPI0025F9B25C|nr:type II CRISPR RNA-guided endonuclease Cas9 [uncultured Thiodictyon sp.]